MKTVDIKIAAPTQEEQIAPWKEIASKVREGAEIAERNGFHGTAHTLFNMANQLDGPTNFGFAGLPSDEFKK